MRITMEHTDSIKGKEQHLLKFMMITFILLLLGYHMWIGLSWLAGGVYGLMFSLSIYLIKHIQSMEYERKLARYRARPNVLELTKETAACVDHTDDGLHLHLIYVGAGHKDYPNTLDYYDIPGRRQSSDPLSDFDSLFSFHAFLHFPTNADCLLFKIAHY